MNLEADLCAPLRLCVFRDQRPTTHADFSLLTGYKTKCRIKSPIALGDSHQIRSVRLGDDASLRIGGAGRAINVRRGDGA
jgi:hypothetical protein